MNKARGFIRISREWRKEQGKQNVNMLADYCWRLKGVHLCDIKKNGFFLFTFLASLGCKKC